MSVWSIALFALVLVACDRNSDNRSAVHRPPVSPASAGIVEDMISISAGPFVGRARHCMPGDIPSPMPKHFGERNVPLTIDEYSIDRRVVSCAEYEKCRAAGACSEPRVSCLGDRGIVLVTLEAAIEYCSWRGARVVKYDEWQRAVRTAEGHFVHGGGTTWNPAELCPESPCYLTSPDGVEFWGLGYFPELTSDTECGEDGMRGPLLVVPSPFLFLITTTGDEATGRIEGRFRCSRST